MTATILTGDAAEQLRTLADESVQCCVTSPPYYGLRDYGTAEWDGGEDGCDHVGEPFRTKSKLNENWGAGFADVKNAEGRQPFLANCGKCGATRIDSQIGLESSPADYIAKLVDVFREVRRVLRKDGVAWVNMGDSYAGGGNYRGINSENTLTAKQSSNRGARGLSQELGALGKDTGVAAKNLLGMPWRLAFALQADGWWLRQDIIWCLSGGAAVYARTQKGDMPIMVKDLVRLRPETVKLWNGSKWTQVLGWNRSTDTENAIEVELRSGERIGCTLGHQWPTKRGLLKASELVVGDVIDTTRLPEPDAPKAADALGVDVAWLCGIYLAEGSMSGNKIQIAGHSKETASRFERIERVAASFHGGASVFASENSATICIYGPVIASVIRAYVYGNTAQDKGIKVRAWARSDEWLMSFLQGYLAGDGHYDADNDRWRLGFCRNDRLADDFRTLAARLGLPLRLNATTAIGFGREWPAYRGDIRLVPSTHHNARIGSAVVAITPSRARQFWDIGVEDEPHTFALASGVLTHNSKPNPMPESVTDRCTKSHEYIFLLSKSERYYYNAEAISEPSVIGLGAVRNVACLLKGEVSGRNDGDRVGVINDGTRNKRSVWTLTTEPYPEAHFATFPTELPRICILAGSRVGDVILDPFNGSGTTGQVALELARAYIGVELNPEYVALTNKRLSRITLGLPLEIAA